MGKSVSVCGMEPLTAQAADKANKRRSQRVLVSVPVTVITQGTDKQPVSEETRTLVVNAHGALVLIGRKVSIGQLLTLKNTKTGEEQASRVVFINPQQAGKSEVGIEFMEPAPRFWRIAFPPEDWTPRSPEAKTAQPRKAPALKR